MEPLSILSQRNRIMINDADFTKKMKLSSAFNYFQEIANMHSDNLGIGLNTIREQHGVMWVLLKIRVDITRYAMWDEEVMVETWPQIPKKFEFGRDYTMTDSKGDIITRCISTWAIIDTTTHELRKSEVIATEYPEFISARAIDAVLGKIKLPDNFELVYKRLIGCSDIDVNGHLNNSKYIDFIMDCFSMEQLRTHQARSIQVSYLNEALPGEIILLYRHISIDNPGKVYIKGVREGDGEQIFTSVLETVPIEAGGID